MRKLKEVLRLHSLGMSQHQIARSCALSQSTVHEYLSAAQAAGVKWPAPENWGDQQIEQALVRQRPGSAVWRKHPEPNWSQIHQELQMHKDLTLQLVWQERRESNPEDYGYSRFCDLYRRWLKKLDLVLRQEHRAGEKMFVDYAGATIPIHDPKTSEVQPAAVFVAVLGKQRKPVLLKRGIAATIEELLLSAEYIMSGGNYEVILCERGIRTFETYTRNTMDISAIPVVKKLSHLPIVGDPSHGTGRRDKVAPMARAAVAAGADGLLIEVHPIPTTRSATARNLCVPNSSTS